MRSPRVEHQHVARLGCSVVDKVRSVVGAVLEIRAGSDKLVLVVDCPLFPPGDLLVKCNTERRKGDARIHQALDSGICI